MVRGDSDDFTDHHPGPEDVALIVEVADCSLSRDRGEKRDNYGRPGSPSTGSSTWSTAGSRSTPARPTAAYPAPTILGESESVELIIDGRPLGRIAVADLLPRRP